MTLTIDLSGPQGNAFYLMGLVSNLGRQLGLDQEKIDIILTEMKSSDYGNLVKTFSENFGVVVDIYKNGKPYQVTEDN